MERKDFNELQIGNRIRHKRSGVVCIVSNYERATDGPFDERYSFDVQGGIFRVYNPDEWDFVAVGAPQFDLVQNIEALIEATRNLLDRLNDDAVSVTATPKGEKAFEQLKEIVEEAIKPFQEYENPPS